jgi:hypothetical protein
MPYFLNCSEEYFIWFTRQNNYKTGD